MSTSFSVSWIELDLRISGVNEKKNLLYFFSLISTWHLIVVEAAVKLLIDASNSYL